MAAATGLAFSHITGAAGEYYMVEIMGSGAALLDYDSDGDLDAYLVQGAAPPGADAGSSGSAAAADSRPGNRLYRNQLIPDGELRFVDVTQAAGVGDRGYGMGVAVGDVDNDGDPDLYVTNFGANVLYRNDGGGRFSDITSYSGTQDERWSTSAAFLDYDRDGDLDLFVTSYVSFSWRYNTQCISPAGRRDYCGPQAYQPLTDRLFRNEGDGRFTDVSTASAIASVAGSGLGVTCFDADGDGWTDIYVANDRMPNWLWMNRGDGRFAETGLMSGAAYNAAGAAEASMGVTAGDFDGDGDDDLFMTHLATETNTLYVNAGGATFLDATERTALGHASRPFTGFGSAWLDYDNDGRLDLFVANGAVLAEPAQLGRVAHPYQQTHQLFRQAEDGRFVDRSASAGTALQRPGVGRGAAFGDVDNDGDVDVLVSENGGAARLLRNEVRPRGHWLTVRLIGQESNRDGAGARVGVMRRDGSVLWRRGHTDGSYLSASDSRVHFGLGEEPRLEGLEVRWPSGQQERFGVTRADQQLTLKEGTGKPVGEAPGAPLSRSGASPERAR